jgi:hypothetical protein
MSNIAVGINVDIFMKFLKEMAYLTMVNCLNIVKDECYKMVPIDTGELRDSIRIESPKWINPFILQGKVLAGSESIPQAWYTEHGTKSHGPVFFQMMHFTYKGAEVYTKWVKGINAMHWMRNAIVFSRSRIQEQITLLIKEFSNVSIVYTETNLEW